MSVAAAADGTDGRPPAGCARPIIAMRPPCSTARRSSQAKRSMSSAGSTAISPRSTRSSDWPPRERAPPTIVFNGDFHWFDAEPAWFAEIERARRAAIRRLRGNVETEIARAGDIGAGCGCAYPPERRRGHGARARTKSSRDLRASDAGRGAAHGSPHCRCISSRRSARLRVGIVHGDAACARRLALRARRTRRSRARGLARRRAARVAHRRVRLDPHLPRGACATSRCPAGRLTVVNNGAAGMPNFSGSTFGVITRIATSPSPHRSALRL